MARSGACATWAPVECISLNDVAARISVQRQLGTCIARGQDELTTTKRQKPNLTLTMAGTSQSPTSVVCNGSCTISTSCPCRWRDSAWLLYVSNLFCCHMEWKC